MELPQRTDPDHLRDEIGATAHPHTRRVSLLRILPFFRQVPPSNGGTRLKAGVVDTSGFATREVDFSHTVTPKEKPCETLKQSVPEVNATPEDQGGSSLSGDGCEMLPASESKPISSSSHCIDVSGPEAEAGPPAGSDFCSIESTASEDSCCSQPYRSKCHDHHGATSFAEALDDISHPLDDDLFSAPSISSSSSSKAPYQLVGSSLSAVGVRNGRSVSPPQRRSRRTTKPHKFNAKWRLSSALSLLNSHYRFDRGPIAFDVDSDIGHRARMEDAYSIVLDVTGVCPSRLLKTSDFFRRQPFSPSTSHCDSGQSGTMLSSSDDSNHPLLLMFAVFDGHGGSAASEFAKSNFHRILSQQILHLKHDIQEALHHAILETDFLFTENLYANTYLTGPRPGLAPTNRSGTTATVVVANPAEGKFWTAHVGDSEAWLFTGSKATRLLRPHSPLRWDERKRILGAGGMVSKQIIGATGRRIGRVNGVLSVSRAIGDAHLKQWVIGTPEVTEHQVVGDEEVLVVASDGLWDTLDPNSVYIQICNYFGSKINRVTHRGRHLRRRPPSVSDEEIETPVDIAVRLCRGCAKHLVNTAIERGSNDNVTCIVILFDGIAKLINSLHGGYRVGGGYRRHDLKRRVKSAIQRLFSGMDPTSRKTHFAASVQTRSSSQSSDDPNRDAVTMEVD